MSTPGVKERLDNPGEQQRTAIENELTNARVATPGIIISFDPVRQTASVQPAITENVQVGDGPASAVSLPILTDVPVQFPRAGGYSLTFPVKPGDECLLVFCDMCIDGWWQSGGVQDQMEKRRHDLSDAMAILGITSVPQAVALYSEESVMLRNEDKTAFVEIQDNEDINVTTAADVNITAAMNINISAAADVSIVAGGNMNLTAAGSMTLKAARIDMN
jgi:hypothetical protein